MRVQHGFEVSLRCCNNNLSIAMLNHVKPSINPFPQTNTVFYPCAFVALCIFSVRYLTLSRVVQNVVIFMYIFVTHVYMFAATVCEWSIVQRQFSSSTKSLHSFSFTAFHFQEHAGNALGLSGRHLHHCKSKIHIWFQFVARYSPPPWEPKSGTLFSYWLVLYEQMWLFCVARPVYCHCWIEYLTFE